MNSKLARTIGRVSQLSKRSLGNLVTLADGITQKPAIYLKSDREVQKYVMQDGDLPGRGKIVVVFVFDGTVQPLIHPGDVLTFNGTKYLAETTLYPSFIAGKCVEVAVPCSIP